MAGKALIDPLAVSSLAMKPTQYLLCTDNRHEIALMSCSDAVLDEDACECEMLEIHRHRTLQNKPCCGLFLTVVE